MATEKDACHVNLVYVRLTPVMPIKLRNDPHPSDKPTASKIPIPIAKSKAVDTEDSCFLSTIPIGLPLVLSSWMPFSV